MKKQASRADLHIHSRFSDQPAEWLFRRLDFPDSCSEPRAIYDALRKRGMDFITITDHNRIEGCLEIADRPGVFLSEQVTTFFPEDHARVHLLVWGITEADHRDIQSLRENIHDLHAWLAERDIAHAVAHPLYRTDEKLGVAHLEKLALMFRHFEGVNGLRDALFSEIAQFAMGKLTREKIGEFANRHNLAPSHDEPWRKVFTGGSDDHGGMFPASAFTETPRAKMAGEFLAHVAAGDCAPGGTGGTPLLCSHGLYNTIHSFVGDKFLKGNKQSGGLIGTVFSRFMEGRDPTEFSLGEKIGFLAQAVTSGKIFELAKPANASLWKRLKSALDDADVSALFARATEGVAEPERRAFLMANVLASQLAFRFFTNFVRQVGRGDIIESIRDLSTLAPVLLTLSPYIYAFQSQSPRRAWLREVCGSFAGEIPAPLQNEKRAWFTDTLEDVNGVATTIRRMTECGVAAGRQLVVVTSRAGVARTDIPIKNFAPIGEFELPEYELQKLSFPPVLEIIDWIQRERFTELIISTPGPVGLTALLAAKLLGLRCSGIYHTDFPQYVRILTDDSFFETLTWRFMHWFYAQMDTVFVNSEHYRRCWIDRGIAPGKIKILPRGLDTALFHPSRRDRRIWEKFGIHNGDVVLLYVGRVSKEKDLDVAAAAYRKLRDAGQPVRLVITGDGPYLPELRGRFPDVHFTGYLAGEELARAFASADVFVFPSTTDTFGNVVIEAMASGLPVVVSDQGGPCELVEDGVTGFVTKSLDAESFASAAGNLIADHPLREQLSANARRAVENRDWNEAFQKFWTISAD